MNIRRTIISSNLLTDAQRLYSACADTPSKPLEIGLTCEGWSAAVYGNLVLTAEGRVAYGASCGFVYVTAGDEPWAAGPDCFPAEVIATGVSGEDLELDVVAALAKKVEELHEECERTRWGDERTRLRVMLESAGFEGAIETMTKQALTDLAQVREGCSRLQTKLEAAERYTSRGLSDLQQQVDGVFTSRDTLQKERDALAEQKVTLEMALSNLRSGFRDMEAREAALRWAAGRLTGWECPLTGEGVREQVKRLDKYKADSECMVETLTKQVNAATEALASLQKARSLDVEECRRLTTSRDANEARKRLAQENDALREQVARLEKSSIRGRRVKVPEFPPISAELLLGVSQWDRWAQVPARCLVRDRDGDVWHVRSDRARDVVFNRGAIQIGLDYAAESQLDCSEMAAFAPLVLVALDVPDVLTADALHSLLGMDRPAVDALPRVVEWSELQPRDLAWDPDAVPSQAPLLLIRASGNGEWRFTSGERSAQHVRLHQLGPDAKEGRHRVTTARCILLARGVRANAKTIARLAAETRVPDELIEAARTPK